LKLKNEIYRILGKEVAIRIEHFGSTAIPNIQAKPTIDILVEIPFKPYKRTATN